MERSTENVHTAHFYTDTYTTYTAKSMRQHTTIYTHTHEIFGMENSEALKLKPHNVRARPKLESARDDLQNVCVIVCCYMDASDRLLQRINNNNNMKLKKQNQNYRKKNNTNTAECDHKSYKNFHSSESEWKCNKNNSKTDWIFLSI